MCGLVGVLTNSMSQKKLDIFQQLMTVATIRGALGAGFAGIPSKPGAVEILRDPDATAADMAYGASLWKLLYGKEKKEFNCLMGHARLPTSGGNEVEDCHPHSSRHIIGMHNGTMTKVMGRKIKKKDNDSRVLMNAMGEQGIREALEQSEGDYAVSVYDKNSQRLYLARNTNRPLHLATIDGDKTTLFWASEAAMLQLVIGRNIVDKKAITHYTLAPNRLLSYRVYFPQFLEYESIGVISTEQKLLPPPNKLEADVFYNTFGHTSVNAQELRAILDTGCANCEEAATMADYNGKKLTFFKTEEFFCEKCLTNDPLARAYLASHHVELPAHIKPVNPAAPSVH